MKDTMFMKQKQDAIKKGTFRKKMEHANSPQQEQPILWRQATLI